MNGQEQPTFEALVDWVDGRLDPQASARVAAELDADPPGATAAVRWLREFHQSALSLPLHQPPPIVGQNLAGYFARWSRARATLERPRLELTARLLFDSRLDLAPVGVRGAGDIEGDVHLAYTTDQADLVLDVHRLGGGVVRLDGQVLLTDPQLAPIFEARVSGPSGSLRTVDGDALGHFALDRVPEDVSELRVSNGDLVIVATLDLRNEDTD